MNMYRKELLRKSAVDLKLVQVTCAVQITKLSLKRGHSRYKYQALSFKEDTIMHLDLKPTKAREKDALSVTPSS